MGLEVAAQQRIEIGWTAFCPLFLPCLANLIEMLVGIDEWTVDCDTVYQTHLLNVTLTLPHMLPKRRHFHNNKAHGNCFNVTETVYS